MDKHDLKEFTSKYFSYTMHLTFYQSMQCKKISECLNLPIESVFEEMINHLDSMDYRLYNRELATKYGLTNQL